MRESGALATNRKARRDYHIFETVEAGIVLLGTEIKSLRARRVSIDDSFARIDEGELFLYNMHVSPYEQGGRYNPTDPARVRKLLVRRSQIERLMGRLSQRGLALIPLRLYLKHGLAKVELALGKGKKFYEKRETIRTRETEREMRRLIRTRQKRQEQGGR